MGWGRLDDSLDGNEKFANLSLAATGLWLKCLPRALRHDDGFVPEKWALRWHEARRIGTTRALIAELINAGLWEEVEGGWLIHDFEKYVSPRSNSAERVRRHRERKAKGLAVVTEVKRVTEDVKRTHAGARASGYPEPVPEPVNQLLPSVVVGAPTDVVEGSDNPVGAYVDACREMNLTEPDGRTKGRVGKAAKELLTIGHKLEDVLEACRELARRNVSPANLGYLVGDIERQKRGIDQTRKFPTRPNPVSDFIQNFSAFSDAEQRGERP